MHFIEKKYQRQKKDEQLKKEVPHQDKCAAHMFKKELSVGCNSSGNCRRMRERMKDIRHDRRMSE